MVELAHCLVAHPLLDELIVEGRFPDASYVTLRVGAATGERLAVGVAHAPAVSLPDDVRAEARRYRSGVQQLESGFQIAYPLREALKDWQRDCLPNDLN